MAATAALHELSQLFVLPDKSTEKLSQVKGRIISLSETLSSEESQTELIKLLQACADASRDGMVIIDTLYQSGKEGQLIKLRLAIERWRNPLGESEILVLASDVLDKSLTLETTDDLKLQCLRLLANCCADNDSNRQRIISRKSYGLSPVIKLLHDERLMSIAFPALNNICVDYGPAQRQAIKDGAAEALFELVQKGKPFDEDDAVGQQREYVFKILDMLAAQDILKDTLNPSYTTVLLNLAQDPQLADLDNYSLILATLTNLLGHTAIQNYVIENDLVGRVLDILQDSYSRFPVSPEADKEAFAILSYNRKKLIVSLSDISGNPAFPQKYPFAASPLLERIRGWLNLQAFTDNGLVSEALQTAACIILGNIATSDEACTALVQKLNIHIPLIKIIGKREKDAGTVFSALGMLRNLTLPLDNKPIMGRPENGIWEALETRWRAGSEQGIEKQVPYATSGLGRLLVKGCFDNARRLLEPPSTAGIVSKTPTAPSPTRLSLLLELYSKVDEVPTKTEIARTLVEILRSFIMSRDISNDELIELQLILYDSGENYLNHNLFIKAISEMIEQDKYPVVRSEGLFGFGLIATGCIRRGKAAEEGCRRIWGAKERWIGAFNQMEEEKKIDDEPGNSGGKKIDISQGKDRENALAILVELRRTLDLELSTEEKSELERLMSKLSLLIRATAPAASAVASEL